MGVACANLQWGGFTCPSCSQKREKTAFKLVLRSVWGLLSPGKQDTRSIVLRVGKEAKFFHCFDVAHAHCYNLQRAEIIKGSWGW